MEVGWTWFAYFRRARLSQVPRVLLRPVHQAVLDVPLHRLQPAPGPVAVAVVGFDERGVQL